MGVVTKYEGLSAICGTSSWDVRRQMGRPQANEPRDIVSRERRRAARERKAARGQWGGGYLSVLSFERAALGNPPPHAINRAIWSTIETGLMRGVRAARLHTY